MVCISYNEQILGCSHVRRGPQAAHPLEVCDMILPERKQTLQCFQSMVGLPKQMSMQDSLLKYQGLTGLWIEEALRSRTSGSWRLPTPKSGCCAATARTTDVMMKDLPVCGMQLEPELSRLQLIVT